MLVDDSMVARAVLSRIIKADPGFHIAAVAGTAEDAIIALGQVDVDVILLDLEMPGAGGLRSLPGILEAARGARVLIVSSLAEEGAEVTVAALGLGAADTMPKPGTGRFHGRFSEILLAKLRALGVAAATQPAEPHAPIEVRSTPAVPAPAVPAAPAAPPSDERPAILAIGASTGGIHALATFFAALPAQIGIPILVTQHLPAPFMEVFARQLGTASGREARVAADGMILKADKIYIAPGEQNLTVDRRGDLLLCRLVEGRSASGCLPSVDPMFASLAAACGPRAYGVVLTGMGRDGLDGARQMIAAGGMVFAQDEASSAVWGMPRAVFDAGLASFVAPPELLARKVGGRCTDGGKCR